MQFRLCNSPLTSLPLCEVTEDPRPAAAWNQFSAERACYFSLILVHQPVNMDAVLVLLWGWALLYGRSCARLNTGRDDNELVTGTSEHGRSRQANMITRNAVIGRAG